MRPHLALQCSIIAFIAASRVTSASNAAHSPAFVSFAAIAAVSSADFRSRSTHSTFAPSCAKRMTVARPLPMPVPGPWPAPTTIAILFCRRMIPFLLCRRPSGAGTVIHNACRAASPCRAMAAMAGLAKSSCSHYVLAPMNDLFDKSRPRRNLDGGRVISIRGAREHNLKNVDVEIPRDQLVVFTGLSGSGKSSLAFDTIYAEGQRRYVESLSAYARQ